jgi:hypothetical protein
MEGKNTHTDKEPWIPEGAPIKIAIALAQLKRSILPISQKKDPPIKWKKYQSERPSFLEIKQWQADYLPVMWAQITGSISGIITLDFDGETGQATMEKLGLNPHRRTGSGGFHVDFNHPGWHVKTENNKSSAKRAWAQAYPGLDIRGDGGYAIIAGSNTSGPYTWLRDPSDLESLDVLPTDLREMLGLLHPPVKEEKPTSLPKKSSKKKDIALTENIADIALEKYLGEASFRGRDNACFDLACQLRDNGYSRLEAENYCIQFSNRTHTTDQKGNNDPFTNFHAKEKVDSAYSYPARDPWEKQEPVVNEPTKKEEANTSPLKSGDPLYTKSGASMTWLSPKEGPVPLSNFSAEILADVITDDGAEQVRSYEIQAAIEGRRPVTFSVLAKDYAKCDWVDEHLGARAIITTGRSMTSHLANAIKTCSDPREDKNFAHTGWRNIDGVMSFLHAGGQISQPSQVVPTTKSDLTKFSFLDKSAPEASLESMSKSNSQNSQNSQVDKHSSVKLIGTLSSYVLPEPSSSSQQAIRASLKYMDLASDRITAPLYTALWRSVLGDIDFGMHITGASGLGKTALVALIQQHLGSSMHAKNLPGSWVSTDNSLEMLLFQAKDTIVTVDDFKPVGSKNDQDRLHAKADRVFRQIGNRSARGRLDGNLQQRAERRSRCLLISTGEDVPRGQSLKSRGVLITMDEKITAGAAKVALDLAQADASSGVYAQCMSNYLLWLAPRIEAIQEQMTTLVSIERDQLAVADHARTNTNAANLIVGMKYFLQFAYESGAISKSEALWYLDRVKAALELTADEATQENKQEKPSEQWRRLLVAALASKKAYLEDKDDNLSAQSGNECVGWIEGDDIFFFPVVAYKVAKGMGSSTGDEITTLEPTLRKFLHADGLLATTDLDTKRKTIAIRKSFGKIQQSVLHIKVATFYDSPYPVGVDLTDYVDYIVPDAAPEEAPVPSQEVDCKVQDLTKLVDYDLTKSKSNGKGHHEAIGEYEKCPVPDQREGGWMQGDKLF